MIFRLWLLRVQSQGGVLLGGGVDTARGTRVSFGRAGTGKESFGEFSDVGEVLQIVCQWC